MKILVIIPAKMDSTRLEGKNMKEVNGKPLLQYSIDYAKSSKYNPDILVTSENIKVLSYVFNQCKGIMPHQRLRTMCGDVEVVDVYQDIIKNHPPDSYDLVVALQPDNPDRSNTLDECIDYMIENNYDDFFTVNPDYKRSGSVRIFKFNYLREGKVSKRVGCMKDEATDIHYQEDLEKVKQKL